MITIVVRETQTREKKIKKGKMKSCLTLIRTFCIQLNHAITGAKGQTIGGSFVKANMENAVKPHSNGPAFNKFPPVMNTISWPLVPPFFSFLHWLPCFQKRVLPAISLLRLKNSFLDIQNGYA